VVAEIGAEEYGRLISSIRPDLLELFGKEYVAQHVVQTWAQEQKELSYRIYVTDCLRLIGENTAYLGSKQYIPRRWIDLIQPALKENSQKETRTAEEIVTHIRKKIAAL